MTKNDKKNLKFGIKESISYIFMSIYIKNNSLKISRCLFFFEYFYGSVIRNANLLTLNKNSIHRPNKTKMLKYKHAIKTFHPKIKFYLIPMELT